MPMPSAPPMTPEYEEQFTAWTLATTSERKRMPNHAALSTFFASNGMEERTFDPYITADDLPASISTSRLA